MSFDIHQLDNFDSYCHHVEKTENVSKGAQVRGLIFRLEGGHDVIYTGI